MGADWSVPCCVLCREIRRSSSSSSSSQEEHIEDRRISQDSSDLDNSNISDKKIFKDEPKEEDDSKEERVDIEGCSTPPHPLNIMDYSALPCLQMPCLYPRLQYPQPNFPFFPLHLMVPPLHLMVPPPPRTTLHKPQPLRCRPTPTYNRVTSPAPDRRQTPDSTLRSPRPRNGIRDGHKKKLSKDERIAIKLGFTQSEIKKATTYPMDEFQDFCNEKKLTEEQINILKDIRRRGKNKIAAQNCRKRKIDMIDQLRDTLDNREAETKKLKQRKENLEDMKKIIEQKMIKTKDHIDKNGEEPIYI